MKQIERRIEELRKQKELLGAMEMDLFAAKQKLEEAKQAKEVAAAAAELGDAVAISVGRNPSGYAYTVREVVKGRVAEVHASDIDILTTYLTRAFNDPKGPKKRPHRRRQGPLVRSASAGLHGVCRRRIHEGDVQPRPGGLLDLFERCRLDPQRQQQQHPALGLVIAAAESRRTHTRIQRRSAPRQSGRIAAESGRDRPDEVRSKEEVTSRLQILDAQHAGHHEERAQDAPGVTGCSLSPMSA